MKIKEDKYMDICEKCELIGECNCENCYLADPCYMCEDINNCHGQCGEDVNKNENYVL